MTRRFFLAPLVLLALLLPLATPAPAAALTPKEQTCPNGLCTFLLPDSYTDVSNQEAFRTFRDVTSNDLFILVVAPVSPDAALSDVVNSAVLEYAKRDGYLPAGSVRDETIGGMRGKGFAYEARDIGGTMIHHEAFFLMRGGTVVNLNFVILPERLSALAPAADLVLASFQFSQS